MKEEGDDLSEEGLLSLLKVQRPEAFWLRQRNEILAKIQPAPTRAPIRWLVPTFAAALMFTVLILQQRKSHTPPPDIPLARDWTFLDKLDLWENWEIIETIREDKT